MHGILQRILDRKRQEVAERSAQQPLAQLRARLAQAPPLRDFGAALRAAHARDGVAVIAEMKRASPSLGVIRQEFHPASIARDYEANGAACLSVLTDRDFFHGGLDDLLEARAACRLPVLRKDFIIDEYQVVESRLSGADCVLLIVAALPDSDLHRLYEASAQLGMHVLVEVHGRDELRRALALPDPLIGINNRNLGDFSVSLDVTLDLLPHVPAGRWVVAESGIKTPNDMRTLRASGVPAFLIGEACMRAANPGQALASLVQESRPDRG